MVWEIVVANISMTSTTTSNYILRSVTLKQIDGSSTDNRGAR
eukprot:gene7209-16886_t